MATIDPLQLILQDSKLEVLPRHQIFQIHYVLHLQMAGTENHNASLIQWKSIMIISVQKKIKIIKLSQGESWQVYQYNCIITITMTTPMTKADSLKQVYIFFLLSSKVDNMMCQMMSSFFRILIFMVDGMLQKISIDCTI